MVKLFECVRARRSRVWGRRLVPYAFSPLLSGRLAPAQGTFSLSSYSTLVSGLRGLGASVSLRVSSPTPHSDARVCSFVPPFRCKLCAVVVRKTVHPPEPFAYVHLCYHSSADVPVRALPSSRYSPIVPFRCLQRSMRNRRGRISLSELSARSNSLLVEFLTAPDRHSYPLHSPTRTTTMVDGSKSSRHLPGLRSRDSFMSERLVRRRTNLPARPYLRRHPDANFRERPERVQREGAYPSMPGTF